MKILFENKQLNEGPGAGYTIETRGYSLNGQIDSVKVSKLQEHHYVAYAIDCDVELVGEVVTYKAEGYYAGTGEVDSLPITCSHIYIEVTGGTLNDWRVISDEDYENDNVNETTLNLDALLDLIKEDLLQGECSFTYGGGWFHVTYDGQVTDDEWLSGVYYTDMKATIYLSNKEDIKQVDRMVDGYGYETMYEVVVDGVGEEEFENEDEAIEYAKSIGAEEVRRIYVTESWYGDMDIEYDATVWTNDDIEESLKEDITDDIKKETNDALTNGSTKEMSNVIFDTLFGNTHYPQFDFSKVENQEVDENKGQIVFDYMGHEYKITIEETSDNFTESCSKPLTEDVSDEERIPALANCLGIPENEIENLWDYEYQTSEGDYLVVTEDEARELAEEDIRNLYDELGLESFTPGFRDWIIMNALDNDWFEDAIRESFESYVEDIENEDGSMGYENRLIEEMHEHQVLSDDDFEIDEDGEPNLRELKEDIDIDDKKEEFIDLLVENAGNAVDYCGDNFGWDWVAEMASQHNLIDMDEVVDECISVDGIAHFIARYDGDEIELENGLYAYRTN